MPDADADTDKEVDTTPTVTLVFCTAEIPTDIIDKFITRSTGWLEAIGMSDYFSVHIQTSLSIIRSQQPTRTPTQPFTSPFLGKTVPEIRAWFDQHVTRLKGSWNVARLTFVVLDERSIADQTCEIVSNGDGEGQARSDFYVALDVLMGPEMCTNELNEGMDSPKWRENGEYVYMLEKWQDPMVRYLRLEAKAFKGDEEEQEGEKKE